MNLRVTCSWAARLVWGARGRRMVITRLVGPGMDPCGVGCDVWEGGVK